MGMLFLLGSGHNSHLYLLNTTRSHKGAGEAVEEDECIDKCMDGSIETFICAELLSILRNGALNHHTKLS